VHDLRIYVGPVHGEKSTQARRAVGRLARLGKKVVLLRPARSRRDHEEPGILVTKNGERFPAVELEAALDALDVVEDDDDVVWFDEPMLFEDEEDVFDVISAIRRKARVVVSGLSATSELDVFGLSMAKLMAVADEIIWCKADCDACGGFGIATRSYCLKQKTDAVLVGGEDVYQAVCVACHRKR
jgi:thymidine kinase